MVNARQGPGLLVATRGVKFKDDWYNSKEEHPGAQYPWGVERIYPEKWIRPERISLFPRVPAPRSNPIPPKTNPS